MAVLCCFLFDLPISFNVFNPGLTLQTNHLARPPRILPVLPMASPGLHTHTLLFMVRGRQTQRTSDVTLDCAKTVLYLVTLVMSVSTIHLSTWHFQVLSTFIIIAVAKLAFLVVFIDQCLSPFDYLVIVQFMQSLIVL